MKKRADFVEVVLKLTERCNINCTYCYMFNMGNDDYLAHPIYIDSAVIEKVAAFLAKGVQELSAKRIRIDFHGGEPLMLKPARFDWLCEKLRREIEPFAAIEFAMQTNGMLINEEWLALFEKHRVGIGISIDGPQDLHDAHRVDHQGKGTHAKVIEGIQRAQKAASEKRLPVPGFLTVINPDHDGGRIYRHLVDDLGATSMNFLLPMWSHDSIPSGAAEKLGKYLCSVFDEWVKDDNLKIKVRILHQTMRAMTAGSGFVAALEGIRANEFALLTIASNGDLGPDDELKPLNFGQGTCNVSNTSLVDFLNSDLMTYLDDVAHTLPVDCYECPWQNYCRGGAQHGSLINRFSSKAEFQNKSALCDGLRSYYSQVATYLLEHDTPMDLLAASLDFADSPYKKPMPIFPKRYHRKIVPIAIAGAD
ncbi:MAG: radical SAM protein [Betaproteobacteria bacterium]|nr:radical SAM protein [Betaproteobacteria bacterium]